MPIQPLGHHELLLLLLQLAILLGVARITGELARRMRTPAVVGELVAGVLLGPSVSGALAPGVWARLFPPSQLQFNLLAVITWLGVIFLLFLTGLETDLPLIRRLGYRAPLTSLFGILTTFGMGLALGATLPDQLLAHPDQRLVFMLFVATAMSISAIPVLARVLMELNAIRRDVGQLLLASGMIDDTVGWILLSVVAGLATAGEISVWLPLKSVASVALLLGASLLVGRRVMAALYRWVDETAGTSGMLVSLTLVLILLMSSLTLSLGLEAILGAFLVGALLREVPRYRPELMEGLEELTRLFFAPIFFCAAGMKVQLSIFTDPAILPYALGVLLVACGGKFIGVSLGAGLAGLSAWECLALGSGLNARGAMEIIVATIGLSLGVLSVEMYSIVVFVAIATSLMAPPMLSFCLQRIPLKPEEARRLAQEKRDRESFLVGVKRVLLPTRGGGNARFAAELLRHISARFNPEVTVLSLQETGAGFWRRAGGGMVTSAEAEALSASALNVAMDALRPLAARTRILSTDGKNPARLIAELGREHDLIVLGASQVSDSVASPFTFSKLIDDLLQVATRPVLVVRLPGGEQVAVEETFVHRDIKKILIPTTGTSTGRIAREVGVALASSLGAEVTFLFVEESMQEDTAGYELVPGDLDAHPLSNLEQARMVADQEGSVRLELITIRAFRAGEAIVQVADEAGYDLIVLNAQLRAGTARAWLGPQVDVVLAKAPCPVAIVILQ